MMPEVFKSFFITVFLCAGFIAAGLLLLLLIKLVGFVGFIGVLIFGLVWMWVHLMLYT
jgi:hypothetical protein